MNIGLQSDWRLYSGSDGKHPHLCGSCSIQGMYKTTNHKDKEEIKKCKKCTSQFMIYNSTYLVHNQFIPY